MVIKLMKFKRAPSEDWLDYWIRVHRIAKEFLKRNRIEKWSTALRYRFFSWMGHLVRLGPEHLVVSVFAHRSLEWWRDRQSSFKHTGKHAGRHKGKGRICGRYEIPLERSWKQLMTSTIYDSLLQKCICDDLPIPVWWTDLAQNRDLWRAFSRWAVFKSSWS